MTPTADDFRALARSSPWRFTHAHFTWRESGREPVEAWLERPGRLRYSRGAGPIRTVEEEPGSVGVITFGGDDEGATHLQRRWGREVEPVRRPDGLVLERPDDMDFMLDDPMLTNYLWVAMLDPDELSRGVELSDLHEIEHHGRRAWRARCVPASDYDPRCSCCPLLWSQVSDVLDRGEGGPRPLGTDYPEAYDVTLDHGTGIVVELRPSEPVERTDLGFDTEIHAAS